LNKANNTKRRQLVVGNWKMNGNQRTNAELLAKVVAGWQGKHNADVAVCPPFPYFQHTLELLVSSSIVLGAQSVSEYEGGAYTGEVSARMLADWQCRYVIVGHNERRRMQQESDTQVAQKFVAVQREQLVPILCVGESLEQRETGQALAVIHRQLNAVVESVGCDAFEHAVVAYEPVWAVGTGKTATPLQAQEVHHFIRELLGDVGQRVRILYGGSVKANNAAQLFAMTDIDGALLGGASLDAEEFLSICRAADV
jgi:triosephosphate isomerase